EQITSIIMSGASLIAYILTSGFLSTGNVGTIIEMAALNLLLMLVCPFTACGVRSIKARLKVPEKARSGRLVMILSIILILFNFIYGILFVALQGATDMIVYYKKLKMWKMNNKPEE
ncbi:MAG: hypothetical protein MJ236_04165, partial [Clostridia bacterium]|nr:hypothetical protein [Clostridia bacterium]